MNRYSNQTRRYVASSASSNENKGEDTSQVLDMKGIVGSCFFKWFSILKYKGNKKNMVNVFGYVFLFLKTKETQKHKFSNKKE